MKIIKIDELFKDNSSEQKLEAGMVIYIPFYGSKYLVVTNNSMSGELKFINLEKFYIPNTEMKDREYVILGKME